MRPSFRLHRRDPLRQEHPAAEILRRRRGLPTAATRSEETQLERTQENLVRIGIAGGTGGPLREAPESLVGAQQARQYLDLGKRRGLEVSSGWPSWTASAGGRPGLADDIATAQAQLAGGRPRPTPSIPQGESLSAQLQEQGGPGKSSRAQIQQNETHRRDRRQRIDLLRDRIRSTRPRPSRARPTWTSTSTGGGWRRSPASKPAWPS